MNASVIFDWLKAHTSANSRTLATRAVREGYNRVECQKLVASLLSSGHILKTTVHGHSRLLIAPCVVAGCGRERILNSRICLNHSLQWVAATAEPLATASARRIGTVLRVEVCP